MPFPLFFAIAGALGANEVITNRRENKRMLDEEAERQDTINNINLGLDNLPDGNVYDARQIQALYEQRVTAQSLLRSKDPKQQQLGATMLNSVSTGIRTFIQQNENEARADKVRQRDREIILAGDKTSRELTMNRQLREDLEPFNDSLTKFRKVMNLLDASDQLASVSALTIYIQQLDDSVVREADQLRYQGTNGLIIEVINILNKNVGKDFDPATKQALRNALAATQNAEKATALAIVNSTQETAISFSLSTDRVLAGIDKNLFTPIDISAEAQRRADDQAAAIEAAQISLPPGSRLLDEAGPLAQIGAAFAKAKTSDQSWFSRNIVNLPANITEALARAMPDLVGAEIRMALENSSIHQAPDGSVYLFKDGIYTKLDENTAIESLLSVPRSERQQTDVQRTDALELFKSSGPIFPIERRQQ